MMNLIVNHKSLCMADGFQDSPSMGIERGAG
jgi:hypothetical protein